MPLVTREGKGSKLTIAEMDGNLTGLNSGQFIFESFLADYPELLGTGGFTGGTLTVPEFIDVEVFFSSLEKENYAPFLGPIIQTNLDLKVFGQIIQEELAPDFSILFNGILFGTDVYGAGNINVVKQGNLFVAQINSVPVSLTYVYNYQPNTGDHSHNFSIESVIAQVLKTTFEISVNDTATSWGDVAVNTYSLVTPV